MSLALFARVACFCPTTMCVLHVQDCDTCCICRKCKHSLRVCKESHPSKYTLELFAGGNSSDDGKCGFRMTAIHEYTDMWGSEKGWRRTEASSVSREAPAYVWNTRIQHRYWYVTQPLLWISPLVWPIDLGSATMPRYIFCNNWIWSGRLCPYTMWQRKWEQKARNGIWGCFTSQSRWPLLLRFISLVEFQLMWINIQRCSDCFVWFRR